MAEITQEEQVKKLKRLLEGWRMALLPLKSVILWEQQWHPCAIVGCLSILYFLIWLMDLNTLTTFAIVGALINLVDFVVPIACNSLYGPTSWTGQKEKIFEDICRSIVGQYNKTLHQVQTFCAMRDTSPLMFYVISISLLCALAWVSSAINNTFLVYLVSLAMLLYPGVQHRGILNMLLSTVKGKPVKGE